MALPTASIKFVSGEMKYFLSGVEVTREGYDRRLPDKPIEEPLPAQTAGIWPMYSEAMAVHPKQIAEATEDARKKGVPTEFDQLGRAKLTNRAHRKAYNKAYGYHDKNGGYGD